MPNITQNMNKPDMRAVKKFTDRKDQREAYYEIVERAKNERFEKWYLINYYGIGGMGKSALIQDLSYWVKTNYPQSIIIDIDFANERMTDPANFLREARNQIKTSRAKWNFAKFDVALAAYNKRLGEPFKFSDQGKIKIRELPQPAKSFMPIIRKIPAVGTLAGYISDGLSAVHQLDTMRAEKAFMRELERFEDETHDITDISGELMSSFFNDLDENLRNDRVGVSQPIFFLFLDTLEKLSGEGNISRSAPISWLNGASGLLYRWKQLIAVIGGRDKLDWSDAPGVKWDIECHLMDKLSRKDATGYFKTAGISGISGLILREQLYKFTDGQPYAMDLCVDLYSQLTDGGITPKISDFGKNINDLVERRYMSYLQPALHDLFYLMAAMKVFSKETFKTAAAGAGLMYSDNAYNTLILCGTCTEVKGVYRMNGMLCDAFAEKLGDGKRNGAMNAPITAYKDTNIVSAAIALKNMCESEEDTERIIGAIDTIRTIADEIEKSGASEELLECQIAIAALGDKALNDNAYKRLGAWNDAVCTYVRLARYEEAKEILENIVPRCAETLGEDNPLTIVVEKNSAIVYRELELLDDALNMQRAVYDGSRNIKGGTDQKELRKEAYCLADIYYDCGMYDEAIELLETLENAQEQSVEDDKDIIQEKALLASAYKEKGEYNKASEIIDTLIGKYTKIYGEDARETIDLRLFAGDLCNYIGDNKKAVDVLEDVYSHAVKAFGKDDQLTIKISGYLAGALSDLGQHEKASEIYKMQYEQYRELYGEKHRDTIGVKNNLAMEYSSRGQNDEAYKMMTEVVALYQEILGDRHFDTIKARGNLANICTNMKDHKNAIRNKEDVLKYFTEKLGDDHQLTLYAKYNLAVSYFDVKRFAEARDMMSEVYNKFLANGEMGKKHPGTLRCMIGLAGSKYYAAKDVYEQEEAVNMMLEAMRLCKEVLGAEHELTIQAMKNAFIMAKGMGR